jgi:general secretion pathway protein G
MGRNMQTTQSRIKYRKSQIANRKSQMGFSLLELMIGMFIIVILLSVALPTYQRSVQYAKERVLEENLWQMRRAIDQYAADKGKLPESLDKLVEDRYLREKPIDPIIEKAEWNEEMGDDPNSTENTQGLKDVKSTADGEDSNGKKYSDY